MSDLYEAIEKLCAARGVSITTMCRELGINRSNLTDLKAGRQRGLSAATMEKIASYFGVSVGQLLGTKEPEDDEISDLREAIRSNPDLRMMFSTFRDASPDDIAKTIEMYKVWKNGN